jgi:uncharacterized protein (DUF58 family)
MTDAAVAGPQTAASDRLFGFDSAFLQKLERLSLASRRPVAAHSAGPRRSRQYGASVEFADFRDYSAGDDFRRIDWNAYGRLDRLFLRLFTAEQITTVTLFLDHSPSMAFGQPTKALTAARLAAILSYVALHCYDAVSVLGWADRIDRQCARQTGRKSIPQVWRSIADIMRAPAGPTNFAALHEYDGSHGRTGLAVVLSDFLTDTDWRAGLRALRGRGLEVSALQILAPEELDPTMRGDWTLHDAETDAEVEVTVSPRLLRRYRQAVVAHTAGLQEFCHRQGMAFAQIPSDTSLTDVAMQSLRRVGVLQ